ncbi:MAG TPA: hypothetical protein PKW90_08890, partial [Myxococcota bacterium]|nr:hypothetical protein [Myxococcota bacterium]
MAQDPGCLFVGEHHVAILVQAEQTFAGRLQDLAVAPVQVFQGKLVGVPLGHVPGVHQDLRDLSVLA